MFALRYDSKTAHAIEEAGGPVRAIVDQVVKDADSSRETGPEFYRDMEERVRLLMDRRVLERIPGTSREGQ